MFVCFHLITTRTAFGRAVYAVGGNTEAARLSGIRINAVRLQTLAITGALSAFSGMMLASRINSGTPDAAQGPAPPSQPPSQDREAEPARPAPTRRLVPVLLGAALLAVGLLLVLPALGVAGLPNLLDVIAPKHTEPAEDPVSPVKLDPRDPDAFEVERATLRKLKVPKPIIVAEKALPRRLELSGSLAFAPNRLAGIK